MTKAREEVNIVSRRHFFSVDGGCKTISDDIHSGSIRLGGSFSHRKNKSSPGERSPGLRFRWIVLGF